MSVPFDTDYIVLDSNHFTVVALGQHGLMGVCISAGQACGLQGTILDWDDQPLRMCNYILEDVHAVLCVSPTYWEFKAAQRTLWLGGST